MPLNPSKRCKDKFELRKKNNQIILHYNDKDYNEKQYCLVFQEDRTLNIDMCRKIVQNNRFTYVKFIYTKVLKVKFF